MNSVSVIRISGLLDVLISGFSDFQKSASPISGSPAIRIPGFPVFRFPKVRKSGFPVFRIRGKPTNPHFRISEHLDFLKSGFQDIWTSGFPHLWISENPDICRSASVIQKQILIFCLAVMICGHASRPRNCPYAPRIDSPWTPAA